MRATNHPPRRSSSLLAARDVGSLAVVTIREGRRGWIEMDVYIRICRTRARRDEGKGKNVGR